MHFSYIADTDVGITKTTNQDSILVKHGKYSGGEILMAIICDGMGGLSKGELASATVIRAFARWFDEELAYELEHLDMQVIGYKWSLKLRDLNMHIHEHAQQSNISMGTTFTGILFIGNEYVITHVGDTRIYHIDDQLTQLTEDQTFIAREIKKGTLTLEQARTDKRRHMLLQCVGASDDLEPQIILGRQEKGTYMLCSDGFYHEISNREMFDFFRLQHLVNAETMQSSARYLIDLAKQRQEKDNISVILIKAD